MTFGKFLGLGFLLAGLLVVFKYIANGFDDTIGLVKYIIWFLQALIGVIVIRRLGTLNYLEDLLVISFWFLLILIFDFIFTWLILGIPVLSSGNYWIGNIILLLALFLFHRKRHVEVRKKLRDKSK